MTRHHPLVRFFGILALTTLPLASPAQDLSLSPPAADEAYDYGEELLRGPVHEAFAEQYNSEETEPLVVDRAPPAAIPEVPPQLKPTGERIEWIPGYWFWDDDRNDYIWISGIWRNIPPGLRWVPGYWDGSSGRHQWIAGTWVAIEQDNIDYLAQAPPESLDYGPVGEPPSANHFWIPGCWNWRVNAYAWRPGYWSTGYSNWVWIPERYLWTPSGHVFCRGYWDYPIANRGVLFAPFWFQRPVYVSSGFRYTPRVSLLGAALQTHFWVRPSCHHYYFGDFYASRYRSRGIHPWHSYSSGGLWHSGSRRHGAWGLTRPGYDPLFSHHHRDGGGRSTHDFRQANDRYQALVDHADRRPPATYRDLRKSGARSDSERFADTLQDLARRNPSRYSRLSDSLWQEYRGRAAATPELASLRRDRETHGPDRHRVDRQPDDAAQLNRPREQGPGSRPVAQGSGSRPGDFRGGSFRLPPDRTASDRGRPRGDRDNIRPIVEQPSSPENERPAAQIPSRPFPRKQRPEIARPEIARPEIGRPEIRRPEIARPEIARPEVVRPEVGGPEISRPEINGPETSRPAIGRPENARPENDRPEVGRPEIVRPEVGRPEIVRPEIRKPDVDSPRRGPAGIRPSIDRPSASNPPRFDRPDRKPSASDQPATGASLPTPKPEDAGPRRRGPERPAGVRPTRQAPRSGRPELESAVPRVIDTVAPRGSEAVAPRGIDAVAPGGATRPAVTKPRKDSTPGSRSKRPSLQPLPSPQASNPESRLPSVAKPSVPAQVLSRPSGARPGRSLTPARSAPRVAPVAQASTVEAPTAPRRSVPTGNKAGGGSRGKAVAKPDGDARRITPRAASAATRRSVEPAVK